ncbi:MAG: type II toxin-antitoxin system death-on-curing family toxin [Burkholderiaceae bacterium]
MNEPIWIDERDARAIHERLLAEFGGPNGIRSPDLLASALARPRQLLAYTPSSDVVDLAAAYTAGIVRNHPFVDGNKRTGFVIGVLFLELNGLTFDAAEEEAARAVIALAAAEIDEAAYAVFLRSHSA